MKPTPSQIREILNIFYFGVVLILIGMTTWYFQFNPLGKSLVVLGLFLAVPAIVAHWIFLRDSQKLGS